MCAIISLTLPLYQSALPDSYADLCGLVTQVHPVRCGKVHRLWHAVATAHFRDKGTGVADHKLAAPLDRTVNLDAFTAQHLRRDLENQEGGGEENSVTFLKLYVFGNEVASESFMTNKTKEVR